MAAHSPSGPKEFSDLKIRNMVAERWVQHPIVKLLEAAELTGQTPSPSSTEMQEKAEGIDQRESTAVVPDRRYWASLPSHNGEEEVNPH